MRLCIFFWPMSTALATTKLVEGMYAGLSRNPSHHWEELMLNCSA